MGAETAFLGAVGAYLSAQTLNPAPKSVGIAEPETAAQVPAVTLWLEETGRVLPGLGERSELVTDGALPVQVTIDLANPVLPEEPSFVLLSPNRLVLTLPHGGQVKADGSVGPLTAADLTVTVGGTPRPVVTGVPAGLQVAADPVVGQLTFATALGPAGLVVASYFLGQWERRTTRIAGTLAVDVFSSDAPSGSTLMQGVLDALQADTVRTEIAGLQALALAGLSSIGQKVNAARKRTARFAFVFELEVNRPDSSGGIIGQIPLRTNLSADSVNAAGAIQKNIIPVAG